MTIAQPKFYSGTSGLSLPLPRSQYPPEHAGKSRLEYYATFFNSIEINSTFYKLPQASTIAKWAQSVPDHFRFTCKLSKTITHQKGLQFSRQDIDDFMKVVEHAHEKEGCLLVQFPPSVKFDQVDRIEKLLEALAEATHRTPWTVAVEFRDPSLYEREVYEILEDYHAILVIHDMAKSATPLEDIWGDTHYVRFHGPEPRYRGDYEQDFLALWATRIQSWMQDKKTVYAYFNNTAGAAFKNLQTFSQLVCPT